MAFFSFANCFPFNMFVSLTTTAQLLKIIVYVTLTFILYSTNNYWLKQSMNPAVSAAFRLELEKI